MSEMSEIRVARAEAAAENLVLLGLEVAGTPLADSYRIAGQYLMFQAPGEEKPRPIAAASAPGAPELELLIKAADDAHAAALMALGGQTVSASALQGDGFAMDQLEGAPVWMFAAGSAIGPIRAALAQYFQAERGQHLVHLLYGVRRGAEVCFEPELRQWEHERGLKLTITATGDTSWDGPTGRVQAHIPESIEDAAEVRALVCGHWDMMKEVTDIIVSRGVLAEHVFRNY